MPWRGPDQPGEVPTLGYEVGDWIEAHCVIPDREHGGEPYKLTDEMWAFLAHHYRLNPNARAGQLATAFHYRRSILVRPQKWGKGPLTAAIVCAEAIGPTVFDGWDADGDPVGKPRPTPRIQIAATTDDQTDNVYGHLVPMILRGPLADLIPDAGVTRVMIPGGGLIEPVTSKATSRLGAPISFAIMDETGLWTAGNKGHDLAKTLRRGLAGMGGRSIETTNAWDPSEASAAQMAMESKVDDIYRDYRKPPENLSYGNKVERRKIHRHAYGDSWWVDLDGIESEAVEIMETDPANAERFFGNRVVAGTSAWLDGKAWDAISEPRKVPEQTQVTLGFDGSDSDDWTGIRAETQDGYQFTPVTSGGPTIWNPADYDGQVPRLLVGEAVAELFKTFDVIRMYCDPPYWSTELDDWASKYGEKRVIGWATFRPSQMHAAAERLRTDVLKSDSPLKHDGCPHTAEHVRNARTRQRPGSRYYTLSKPGEPGRKIDLVPCSVLAHEAAGDATAGGLWRKRYRSYAA